LTAARPTPSRLQDRRGASPAYNSREDELKDRERRLSCLEKCIEGLEKESRELIFDYYRGEQREKIDHRRRLAAGLGIPVNALSIRACRIRAKLATCVTKCCSQD